MKVKCCSLSCDKIRQAFQFFLRGRAFLHRINVQGCIGLAIVSSLLGVLGYAGFRQLAMRGMQAEARLLLGYMQTLQNAYHIEQGQYAQFLQLYGAPVGGQDHCEQPLGAAQLGFIIHGCHDIKSPAPRYAYRSLQVAQPKPSYRLEAESGSDAAGRSLVCFNPEDREFWVAEQNKDVGAAESCW